MGDEADLPTGLFPPARSCPDTRCAWPVAASWTFDRRRGNRAAILLRCGVDRGDFADCPVAAVEDAAQVGSDGPTQTGSLCPEPVCCRRGQRLWDVASHPPHRARRTDGRRLGPKNISQRGPLNRRSLGFARDDKGKGDTSMEIGRWTGGLSAAALNG